MLLFQMEYNLAGKWRQRYMTSNDNRHNFSTDSPSRIWRRLEVTKVRKDFSIDAQNAESIQSSFQNLSESYQIIKAWIKTKTDRLAQQFTQ